MLQAGLPSTNGWSSAEPALEHALRYSEMNITTALILVLLLVLEVAVIERFHISNPVSCSRYVSDFAIVCMHGLIRCPHSQDTRYQNLNKYIFIQRLTIGLD